MWGAAQGPASLTAEEAEVLTEGGGVVSLPGDPDGSKLPIDESKLDIGESKLTFVVVPRSAAEEKRTPTYCK